MALKFHSIGQIEHERVPFIDAVTDADTFNGAFGDVEDGVFKVGVAKTKVIMQVECGDEEGLPKYPIAKGTHVRVLDLDKSKRNLIEIYDYPLPDTVDVGDKLESQADGSLKVSASPTAAVYLTVTKIIGNHDGVVAEITAKA
ncbi:hypothetical protein H8S37_04600 [Mediterraneibacter sp. NSJ-55]|uniref:Uncharacterized protein n=1 Tax=Mediterraneibacter hominis TaxID=2763054 RepID=A0A923LH41_9FIRM|nr:hypothetical protein [Mediterraneibacter hominis]MBC5688208.1 hypothetical protein [Mediterraneibacter hominis]